MHEKGNDRRGLQPTRTVKPRCAAVMSMTNKSDLEGWIDGCPSTESKPAVGQQEDWNHVRATAELVCEVA